MSLDIYSVYTWDSKYFGIPIPIVGERGTGMSMSCDLEEAKVALTQFSNYTNCIGYILKNSENRRAVYTTDGVTEAMENGNAFKAALKELAEAKVKAFNETEDVYPVTVPRLGNIYIKRTDIQFTASMNSFPAVRYQLKPYAGTSNGGREIYYHCYIRGDGALMSKDFMWHISERAGISGITQQQSKEILSAINIEMKKTIRSLEPLLLFTTEEVASLKERFL